MLKMILKKNSEIFSNIISSGQLFVNFHLSTDSLGISCYWSCRQDTTLKERTWKIIFIKVKMIAISENKFIQEERKYIKDKTASRQWCINSVRKVCKRISSKELKIVVWWQCQCHSWNNFKDEDGKYQNNWIQTSVLNPDNKYM